MTVVRTGASLLALLGLAACVVVPSGPSATALPGSRKSFEQFRADDASCRQYATAQIGGSAVENANNSAVASAVVGTVIGAAAGAAIGGSSGAGVGAGVGLLAGSASGAGAAQMSYGVSQRRYDDSYTQCMYAAGHRVAVAGHLARSYRSAQASPANPPGAAQVYRPPPPGYQPPPDVPPDYLPPGSIPPPNAPPPR